MPLLRAPIAACLLALPSLTGCSSSSHPVHATPAMGPQTPLILGLEEGERRVRRRRPEAGANGLTTPFIIKVDRANGGSPDLVMGYEDIVPGQAIVPHRHLLADEILFIHAGTAQVELGDRKTSVTAGATVYIPRNTRIAVRNTGTVPLSVVFVFSKPGFEELLRASSVRDGDSMVPLSEAERAAIREQNRWHTVYDPTP